MNNQSLDRVRENETIGIQDNLTPYIQRINKAVAYMGNNDHEDVRTILKDYSKNLRQSVISDIKGMATNTMKTGDTIGKLDNLLAVPLSAIEDYEKRVKGGS